MENTLQLGNALRRDSEENGCKGVIFLQVSQT